MIADAGGGSGDDPSPEGRLASAAMGLVVLAPSSADQCCDRSPPAGSAGGSVPTRGQAAPAARLPACSATQHTSEPRNEHIQRAARRPRPPGAACTQLRPQPEAAFLLNSNIPGPARQRLGGPPAWAAGALRPSPLPDQDPVSGAQVRLQRGTSLTGWVDSRPSPTRQQSSGQASQAGWSDKRPAPRSIRCDADQCFQATTTRRRCQRWIRSKSRNTSLTSSSLQTAVASRPRCERAHTVPARLHGSRAPLRKRPIPPHSAPQPAHECQRTGASADVPIRVRRGPGAPAHVVGGLYRGSAVQQQAHGVCGAVHGSHDQGCPATLRRQTQPFEQSAQGP
mmetsp:Transcript_11704/g.45610  ORF Transcript_11704/g.45610 Transcript_11704/m.45610 type:complete len:338 (+) Transcript_11704:2008-3021(+)